MQIPYSFQPNHYQGGASSNQVKVIGNYSYWLNRCLGVGQFGQVYEGIENNTKSKVAIKKVDFRTFQRDPYLKNQIISEIQILKEFNHQNIVKFIDLITTKNSLYLVTELCQNGDLSKLLLKQELSEKQCIKIMKHIVEGFKKIIKKGIIHRDLKPANILIQDGVFKIADFGFAKYVEGQQLFKSCVGSPLYMSPQILMRKLYGTKCDIWSLGIIFYEMLFRQVPWHANDEQQLLNNIQNIPLQIRNPNLSKFSINFLKRSLVIDEQRRMGWEEIFQMFQELESQNLIIQPDQQIQQIQQIQQQQQQKKDDFFTNGNEQKLTYLQQIQQQQEQQKVQQQLQFNERKQKEELELKQFQEQKEKEFQEMKDKKQNIPSIQDIKKEMWDYKDKKDQRRDSREQDLKEYRLMKEKELKLLKEKKEQELNDLRAQREKEKNNYFYENLHDHEKDKENINPTLNPKVVEYKDYKEYKAKDPQFGLENKPAKINFDKRFSIEQLLNQKF